MSTWYDIDRALDQAKEALTAADEHATRAANLVAPRLRHVKNLHTLQKMKAELQNFNAVTGKWKNKK